MLSEQHRLLNATGGIDAPTDATISPSDNRTLLMNVIPFPFTQHLDLRPIDSVVFDRVLQHGERLIALVGHQRAAFEFLPFERRVGLERRQKKAVALIDLREVDGHRLDSALPGLPVRRHGGLHHIDGSVANQRVGLLAGPEHGVWRVMPFVPQESDEARSGL